MERIYYHGSRPGYVSIILVATFFCPQRVNCKVFFNIQEKIFKTSGDQNDSWGLFAYIQLFNNDQSTQLYPRTAVT